MPSQIPTNFDIVAQPTTPSHLVARRIDHLVRAAWLLDPEDADLINARFVMKESLRVIAARRGRLPHTISRRLRALVDRLESRPFAALVEGLSSLPRLEQDLARLVLVQRHSLRDAAERTGRTYQDVRNRVRVLRLWQRLLVTEPSAAEAVAQTMHRPG